MNVNYYERYKKEAGYRTFRIGIYTAIIGILVIPYFYWLDLRDLGLTNTLPWRLLGLSGSILFFLVFSFKKRWNLIIGMHAVTLLSAIGMMQGISYQIFTNPSSGSTQEFGATAGNIMVWMITAILGSGARWILVLFSSIILAILGLALSMTFVKSPGLIATIYLFAISSIVIMYIQERQDRNKARIVYELEEREEKIELQSKMLKKANENLRGFNYAISHDLKGPVRRAYSYTQLLEGQLKKKDISFRKDYITDIKDSLKKGYQAIEDLLLFSELGEEGMNWSEVDLDRIVDDIWKEYASYQLEQNNRNIEFQKSSLGSIRGDEKLLQHLFGNLISNAVKYTAKSEKAIINIDTYEKDHNRVIQISDNGIGFDNAIAKQLGEPFKRFHSTKDFKGTGVGLAIVKRIINMHNGKFWANGQPNEGASFFVSFPLN
jgi:signal transduction histidine kinase